MKRLLAVLLSLLVALPAAYAQERKTFPQAELDQMLAPVALYPDPLLSQVLMASTYPLEIVEAARWSRANPGLQGDEAVRAVAEKDWDPSVKSLLAFPDLLARMDEQLDWTRRLGDAFLAQEEQVMDTVQQLRKRAQASGSLAPDERQRVVTEGDTIAIEPANPQVVYVPYYDPYVVYGPWWWSAYPPVVWAPWPGYAVASPGFWWGVGIGISTGFFYGGFDWHHGHVKVVHSNNHYVKPAYHRQHAYGHKPVQPGKWQHDNWHRRGVGQRYEERRAEHRRQPMPPAFRTASQQHQQPRFDKGGARPDHRPPHGQQPRPDKPQHGGPQHGQQPRPDKPQHGGPQHGQQPRPDKPQHGGPQHGQQPRPDKPQHGGPQHGQQPRPDKPQHGGPQHGAQPRAHAPQRGPQPRMEAPQRSQPRMEAHRPQAQPRMESRGGGGQPRMETRGGGGFGGGARGGDHGGRGGGRG